MLTTATTTAKATSNGLMKATFEGALAISMKRAKIVQDDAIFAIKDARCRAGEADSVAEIQFRGGSWNS